MCANLASFTESIATSVEDKALNLLLDLFHLDPSDWASRTFTTGATASNILGLLCGRENIVNEAVRRYSGGSRLDTVGECGLLSACSAAGIDRIQVLTTMPHSSLLKSCSVYVRFRTLVAQAVPLLVSTHVLEEP